MDMRQRAWHTHDTTHGPHEAQEEDQRVDVSVLLRRDKKIIKGSMVGGTWEKETRGEEK